MKTVWLLGDQVQPRLREALEARDLVVLGPSLEPPKSFDVVAPLLTDQFIAENPGLLEMLEPWAERIVPISLTGLPVAGFEAFSQLMLPALGPSGVASRIALIAHTGGKALVSWGRVVAAARAWDLGGRRQADVIAASEVATAQAVLATFAIFDIDNAALVEVFLTQSQKLHLRRRRAAGISIAVVTLILASASAVALVQRSQAKSATTSLGAEAAHSESLRLARSAIDTIDQDPDLARILAAGALRLESNDVAREAGLRAIAATPPHHSIPLDALPSAVSVGRHMLAVTTVAGGVEMRTFPGGELHATLAPPEGLTTQLALLSPNDRWLALQFAGSYEIRSATAKRGAGAVVPGEPWVWLDDDRLLAEGADGRLQVRQVDSASAGSVFNALPRSPHAVAVAPDQGLLAVARGTRITVARMSDGSAISRYRSTSAVSDLAFRHDGALLLVMRGYDTPQAIVKPSTTGSDIIDTDLPGAPLVRPLTSGGFVAIGGNGAMFLIASGQDDVTLSARLPAHRGSVVSFTDTSSGGFVSTGTDGYLRVWDPPPVPSYPWGIDTFADIAQAVSVQESLARVRSRLVLSPDGESLVATTSSLVVIHRASSRTLEPIGEARYLGSSPELLGFPTPDGSRFVTVSANEIGVLDAVTGTPIWTTTFEAGSPLGLLAASTEDGSEVGMADRTDFRAVSRAGDETGTVALDSTAVAVVIGPDGTPAAVTTSGRLSALRLQTQLTPTGVGAVAAGSSLNGTVFVVGTDSHLYRFRDGQSEDVLALPTGAGAIGVSVSPNDSQVAILGADAARVYEVDSERLIGYWDNTQGVELDDLVWPSSSEPAIAITNDLGLVRWSWPSVDELSSELADTPREATQAEQEHLLRAAFS